MSQKINQLCKTIASHPSKINLLNQAIKMALNQPEVNSFRPIIQLIKSFSNSHQISKFRDNKLQIIFTSLLSLSLSNPQRQMLLLLEETFNISNQKEILVEQFIKILQENTFTWSDWPINLLIQTMERLSQLNQQPNNSPLILISKLIIDLPHLKEFNASQDIENSFKKSFQNLLMSTLANPFISKELLQDIYHNLGERVFSKLQNPLILSNHCLDKFANDSELQIEVLSCLFLLVGKYGLELQQFYPKLERLVLKRQKGYSIYELPNSRRFFKLLQAALRSSRVPFKTISSFAHILIKQLAGQQSQFAFWSLSFIVNLTKKHRKLLDQLPLIAQLKVLKYHYNPKIKALVQELSKNLNKVDYLEIEDFGNINFGEISQSKMTSLMNSLQNQDMEFKIPAFDDPI